ncbi:hypothetical protein M413DRAFT_390304 [Hebeloma cylindrosporum]|uniref:Uncharacterized protein n=1 Tax=Hebeloma cylindrosporum TaxID=76867 RepID=A0A0C3CI97_HEBCY|nr:hypothetical protein M413DRAFT_390304 [Hebeloma cylindrosporum h7]
MQFIFVCRSSNGVTYHPSTQIRCQICDQTLSPDGIHPRNEMRSGIRSTCPSIIHQVPPPTASSSSIPLACSYQCSGYPIPPQLRPISKIPVSNDFLESPSAEYSSTPELGAYPREETRQTKVMVPLSTQIPKPIYHWNGLSNSLRLRLG